jgi:ribonuclease BN (tRNA processing enzyme)
MNIKFLGSGSAFVLASENYHSNILISKEVNGIQKNLLFDVGTTIAESLHAGGYEPKDIDSIFISHLHADHAGGLEYIAFKTYFDTWPFGQNKIILVSHDHILADGWNTTWSGGLKSLRDCSATLHTYFKVHPMSHDDVFDFYGTDITIFRTKHVSDFNYDVPSYGIMIKDKKKKIMITGDCQFNSILMNRYEEADVIFHDCELADYSNPVHSQYHQLKTLPDKIKAKIWLYHYTTKNGEIELPNAVADGFLGFVNRGDTFNFGAKE